jgi:flagellar hook-length control protein FliK
MNLLPVATPTAPANGLGGENPATAGSGDFAALVAMLVATASTTLPVDPTGQLSGWGDGPHESPAMPPTVPLAAPAVSTVATALPESPAQAAAEALPVPPGEILPDPQANPTGTPAALAPAAAPLHPWRDRELPTAPSPGADAEGAASPTPPPALALDGPDQTRRDAPAPGKAEGPAASKIAVVPSASQGSAYPVVPLVVAARSEALVPVETPPPAPVMPASVPEQIVSAVVPLHGRGGGRHEVTLELRPDTLGTIRVEVSVEHQTVHLTLHAAEPATSRLLAAALPDLRSALADAGLTPGQLGVGPDGGGSADQRRRAGTDDGDERRSRSAADPGPAGETAESVRTVRPAAAGRLDLFL